MNKTGKMKKKMVCSKLARDCIVKHMYSAAELQLI